MSVPLHLRRPQALFVLAVVALFVVVGIYAPRSSAHSRGHRPARADAVKPTVVLVHGAWVDSSSWDGVIGRLQADGYRVVAVATPLRSLSGDAAYVASVLKSISGPIVLVGHSYGGAVVTNAAVGNANIKALVYIDAFVPAEGESVLKLASMNPGSLLPTSIAEVPYSGGSEGSGVDVYIKSADFRAAFAADVPKETAALMAVTQRPIALAALTEASGVPAWKTIPSWYLVGLEDKAIPVATQEFMARRAGSHIVKVNSSHAAPVSHPGPVTQLILTAIHRVG